MEKHRRQIVFLCHRQEVELKGHMTRDAKKLILAITMMFVLGYKAREAFSEPESETVEVTAIGVGKTVEDAQKNAIINAVQQVVGLYVDAETFAKNEQLVVDQVLSISSGFVSSFEVKLPPRKRLTDGLFETTITAVCSALLCRRKG